MAKKSASSVHASATTIEAGDAGIWVTCDLNKEAKCTAELMDLFNEVKRPCLPVSIYQTVYLVVNHCLDLYVQYASMLYGPVEEDKAGTGSIGPADGDGDGDIEAEIRKELDGLRTSRRRALFHPVRLDINCGKYENIFPWASLV